MVRSMTLLVVSVILMGTSQGQNPVAPEVEGPAGTTVVVSEIWTPDGPVEQRVFLAAPAAPESAPLTLPAWASEPERPLAIDEIVEANFLLQRIADEMVPFDWREHATVEIVECLGGCWYLGLATPLVWVDGGGLAGVKVTVSSEVFYDGLDQVRWVVTHELAHVWQFAVEDQRPTTPFDEAGEYYEIDPWELEADCLAAFWGEKEWQYGGYWYCHDFAVMVAGEEYLKFPLP